MAGGRVELWKVGEMERYLRGEFVEAVIEHYPRGGVADLFVVAQKTLAGKREVKHQLLVKGAFWDRYPDPTSLRDALATIDVVGALKKAGDTTVDLY